MPNFLGIPADILMNIATILFLLASLPQMVKSYRRRKNGLEDFSFYSWIICMTGILTMSLAGIAVGAWVTVIIESWQFFYHIATLYWMFKYRK